MPILQAIANLLGTTPATIVIASVMLVVMVVAWYAFKLILNIGKKLFAAGFAIIFMLAIGWVIFRLLVSLGG